jgi:WD40 repeat protein/predicted Ser/Thr protein kinase
MSKNTSTYDDLAVSVSHSMLGMLLDGRYQIVDSLGEGGFGQTYIARDTRRPGNPTCVVKHLKPASGDLENLQIARRLFVSEAETLEQLGSHDQIPRLLAYFEENQEFYLVQEFIAGHLLSEELQPNRCWSEQQVIQLLQEVLSILEFVHRHNVIHRDIKPENLIRRDGDNKLVLIDFGIVKQVQRQLGVSQPQLNVTVAIGTTGYIPAEQAKGKPHPNSDIYALGAIGIQALTGLHPTQFPEDSNTGELCWQQHVSVSDGLAAILSKMVRDRFQDRYQSATETLQALQHLKAPNSSKPTANPARLARTEIAPSSRHVPTEQLPAATVSQQTPALSARQSQSLSNLQRQNTDSRTEPPRTSRSPKLRKKIGTRKSPVAIAISSRSKIISLLIGTGLIVGGMATFFIFVIGLNPVKQPLSTSTLSVPQEEFLSSTLTSSSFIKDIAFSPDGKTLISGTLDNTVEIWDIKTEKIIQTISDHYDWIYSVAVSPDGQILASASGDKTIKLWNLHTGELLHTLKGHSWPVLSIAISPDGQTLVSGSEDNTIKLWNLKTGELLDTFAEDTVGFSALDISTDGWLLAGGRLDNAIAVWEMHTGKLLHILRGHSDRVNSVAIAANSAILASGSADGSINIWNLYTGELIRTLSEHSLSVESVAISPDSQLLASGSKDGTIKLWNLHSGKAIHTFFENLDPVDAIAFSPDGQTIASGSRDKAIKIWRVPEIDLASD